MVISLCKAIRVHSNGVQHARGTQHCKKQQHRVRFHQIRQLGLQLKLQLLTTQQQLFPIALSVNEMLCSSLSTHRVGLRASQPQNSIVGVVLQAAAHQHPHPLVRRMVCCDAPAEVQLDVTVEEGVSVAAGEQQHQQALSSGSTSDVRTGQYSPGTGASWVYDCGWSKEDMHFIFQWISCIAGLT